MKVLVLGASGLIGHTLIRELSSDFNVIGTLHKSIDQYENSFFQKYQFIQNVEILNFEVLKGVIMAVAPDVILNCIGVTKRKISSNNFLNAMEVNACFPHKLAKYAASYKIRVIHFSTDCVFDGKKGNYTEADLTTAEDFYGRTKALGEIVNYDNCLTIRSSFIGQELFDKTELLDWFLSQEGRSIKGFKKTFYSGVSTIFMTKVIKEILSKHSALNGLYQLAPETPISKYELLNIAKEVYHLNVEIIPDTAHIHTPTLNASKFRNKTGIKVPDWKEMMEQLAKYKSEY